MMRSLAPCSVTRFDSCFSPLGDIAISRENDMLFITSLNFTERGIREIKDDPKRAQAAQDLAKKCGCAIKQIFLTSGEYDLMQIIETSNSDNIAKYALANGSLGFVRSRTILAWPLEETTKIISELP